ncbi:MAG TPA: DNA-protecting protein DprA [Planctomycetes bacterium]|nr:DNA-protecting protein DprA [Planctomycetota bacterium]HIJ70429.1 DNA-protecting protein DprA [Planctomycetota bacterium]
MPDKFCEGRSIGTNHQNSPDIENWLRLIRADGVGPVMFARLLKRLGSVDRALGASVSELTKVDGIGFKTAERIARSADKFDAQKELAAAAKAGVWIINAADKRYPPPLRGIYDPPPVLYVKGTLKRADNLGIAIVGTRRCSTYGEEQAARFGHMLASAGFTIVSGMARGIDTAAHRGALAAGGRTIAVHGCGLKTVFPPENKKLIELAAESGACLSELPVEYEALPENFPPRNRIISGLSLGVILIEAPPRSGALLTAKAALSQNREVMVVPGKIDSPLNVGSHRLVKEGAKLVDCIEDVMEALGYIGADLKGHATGAAEKAQRRIEAPLFDVGRLNLSEAEKAIYDFVGAEPMHVDEIIVGTGLGAGNVNSGMISLRLKGLIKQLPGNLFKRN